MQHPHSYEARIRRVLRHIHDNPAGDLSLDALADVAAMSRFHWHRVFRTMTGETCAQAVRRLRAHRAATWLVQTDRSIERIARDVGYDNLQSFNRFFRSVYGQTPVAFRSSGEPGGLAWHLRREYSAMYDVTIETMPERRLAAMIHTGAYPEIGRTFDQLGAVLGARGMWPQVRGMVAVYYGDPSQLAEAELTSHAGAELAAGAEPPEGTEAATVAGGRHAVLTYKGPYSGIGAAWDELYGQWLPKSGEIPAEAPPYELYLNSPLDTAPEELLTQICVPLAAKG